MSDPRLKHLLDAVQAIRFAREFVGGRSLGEYSGDAMCRSAVERQLEVLGEAFVRLQRDDPGAATRLSAVPFAIGLRNRLIHRYDGVDDGLVHACVRQDLPELESELADWLRELDPGA